jgi:hypothetical protein
MTTYEFWLGWIVAAYFCVRYVLTRKHLKAIQHDIALIKLFVSTGGRL